MALPQMAFSLEATLNHSNTPPPTQGSESTFKGIDNLSTDSSLAISTVSSKYQGRRYTGKLPISDIPELVELCSRYLQSQNVTGLAMLARQAGLPPHLRCKIWPVLLKTHPFVQNPYIEIDLDEDNENDEMNYSIPIKDIRFDLRKYLRSSEKYIPKILTNEIKDFLEIQNKIFDVIEYAIVKFLKKWNKIIHYNSSLTWIALGLAEWVPALPNSNYVLCGRDDVAKNGTKLRDINDNSFEKLSNNSNISSNCSEYSSDTSSTTTDNFSLNSISTGTSDLSIEGRQMTFAEMYERMVLVILHSPEQPDDEDDDDDDDSERDLKSSDSGTFKGDNDDNDENNDENIDDDFTNFKQYSVLAKKGGLIKDRISFFLFCLRKLMPELYNYLGEEDCLNGDWILWWLKYCGSKVWSRYDRGRTWDLVLGYRTKCEEQENNLKELENLSIEQRNLLGQDIFWNPLDNINDLREKNKIDDNVVDTIIDGDEEFGDDEKFKHDRSMSVLTLKSKTNEQTPILSSVELNNELADLNLNDEIDIPFSMIHPHVEIIFIGLAFLKSKEFTIMELDHAEIKTLFSKLSSLKTDFGEMNSFVGTRDENDNIKSLENNHNENLIDNKRKSNRDIENIVIEAGELWRKFLYINMIEE